MKFSSVIIPINLVCLPLCAFAQDTIPTLEPIVVSASRSAQPLDNAIGDITIIDGIQLRDNSTSSISHHLKKQAGIQVSDNGGNQTVTSTFIRGASPAQSLYMIDGIRINDSITGSALWGVLNPASFNRLEIVRGSASSLYGSNAMGGVINLINSSYDGQGARPMRSFANMGAGSANTFRTNIGVNGATDTFDYSIAAAYAQSGGYSATNKEAGPFSYHNDDDGYTLANISGSIGYLIAPDHHLGISFFNGYSHGDFDSGPFYNDTYSISKQQVYSLTSSNQISDAWQSVLRFGFSQSAFYSSAAYGRTENKSIQRQFTWQNNVAINDHHTVSLLLEHLDEAINSTSKFDLTKRHTTAVGAIYQGHINRHHIQASIRNDNYSQYGNKITGSLAYDVDITPHLTIGVAGNTGFRTPTFTDQFSSLNWGFKGNPNLKPERSRNLEAHLTYSARHTKAGITLFHTRYKDLINPYDCSMFPSPCTTTNTQRATIKGVSLQAEHLFGNTRIYAGADFLSTKDNDTNKRLIRRASQVFRAGVSHTLGMVELGVDYAFTGHRFDDTNNTSKKRLGGYGLVNARAALNVNKAFSAQLYVNNVFNKKYNPAYGYNGEGTTIFLNLSWQQP